MYNKFHNKFYVKLYETEKGKTWNNIYHRKIALAISLKFLKFEFSWNAAFEQSKCIELLVYFYLST